MLMSNNNGTTLRVVLFILTWINTFAASRGWYHIENINEEDVSIAISLVVSGWALYRNNNFTKESKIAQQKLDTLKENKKSL